MVEHIGIYAYGSLIERPGEDIKPLIEEYIDHVSPWPIEYARSSSSREGAPTVVIFRSGSHVNGKILRLSLELNERNLQKVIYIVHEREERPGMNYIKTMTLGKFSAVVYCDIPATISNPTPDILAQLAINSVKACQEKGKLEKNGIRYLLENINRGVITPLTESYKAKILEKTGTNNLEEAELSLIR